MTAGRPFSELRDSGLLWLINRAVFHPRGFALGLVTGEDGEAAGWELLGDGSGPWSMDSPEPEFKAAEETLAAQRREGGPDGS